MAGHGPYVWGCYGITALVLVYLVVSPLRRQKRFLQEQRRLLRVTERWVAADGTASRASGPNTSGPHVSGQRTSGEIG